MKFSENLTNLLGVYQSNTQNRLDYLPNQIPDQMFYQSHHSRNRGNHGDGDHHRHHSKKNRHHSKKRHHQ